MTVSELDFLLLLNLVRHHINWKMTTITNFIQGHTTVRMYMYYGDTCMGYEKSHPCFLGKL